MGNIPVVNCKNKYQYTQIANIGKLFEQFNFASIKKQNK